MERLHAETVPRAHPSAVATIAALGHPAHSLLGVIDDPPALGPLRAALVDAGIAPEGIDVLWGAGGRDRYAVPSGVARVAAAMRRCVESLGAESARSHRHERWTSAHRRVRCAAWRGGFVTCWRPTAVTTCSATADSLAS